MLGTESRPQPLTWIDRTVVVLSGVFLTLASVSHTIALRYTILVLLLMIMVLERPSLKVLWQQQKMPLLAVWGFVIYALLHTLFLSHWFTRSMGEFYNQLLVGGLWFSVGIVLFRRWRGIFILDLVIMAGVILACAELLYSARDFIKTGSWPFMTVYLTDTKLEFTFFMNFVLGFVAAALCFTSAAQQRFSYLPKWALVIIAVVILFTSLRAGARNGMIGMVYLIVSMLAIYMIFGKTWQGWKQRLSTVLLVLLGVALLAGYAIKKDDRNQSIVESIVAGWHYKETNAWLRTAPLPLMKNGQPVDGSAYERVAWIHSGLALIQENLLGYGFARNTFGLTLQEKQYQPNTVAHSHSGFIDFGIGLGVIGVLLWIVLCLVFMTRGFKAFRSHQDTLGLALLLITTGYMGRMLIESINKDHMLHIFLFVAGASLAELAWRKSQLDRNTIISPHQEQSHA